MFNKKYISVKIPEKKTQHIIKFLSKLCYVGSQTPLRRHSSITPLQVHTRVVLGTLRVLGRHSSITPLGMHTMVVQGANMLLLISKSKRKILLNPNKHF